MIKLIIIWLLNLFDYICTYHITGKYGLDVELNPLMRFLLPNPLLAFVVKMGVTTITCILCYMVKDKPIIKVMTWFLLIFYVYIAIHTIFNLI